MAVNQSIKFSNMAETALIYAGAGNDEAKFHIHTDLLITASPYFAAFLKNPLTEFRLSNEYTAAAFELFCQWLYCQTDPISGNTSNEDCVDALLLGLLLKVPSFANICKQELDSRLGSDYVNGFFKFFEVPTVLGNLKFFRKVLVDKMAKKAAEEEKSLSSPLGDQSSLGGLDHLFEATAGQYQPRKRNFINTATAKETPKSSVFATNTTRPSGIFQSSSLRTDTSPFKNSHVPPITLPFPIASSNNYPTSQSFQSTEKPGFGSCQDCKGGGIFDFMRNRCATCEQTQTLSSTDGNTNNSPKITKKPFDSLPSMPTTSTPFSLFQTSANSYPRSTPFPSTPVTTTSTFGMAANSKGSAENLDTRLPIMSTSNDIASGQSYSEFKTHQTPGSSLSQSKWGNTQNQSPFATHATFSLPFGGLLSNTNSLKTTNVFTQSNNTHNQPAFYTPNTQSTSLVAKSDFVPFEEQDSFTNTKNRYQSINAHPSMQSFSPEELRFADYSAGRSSKPNIVNKDTRNQPFNVNSNNFPPATGELRPAWNFGQVTPTTTKWFFYDGTTTATTLNPSKDAEKQAEPAGDTQGQLKALSDILANLVVDVNQRLSALEGELASQSPSARTRIQDDKQKDKLEDTKSAGRTHSETEKESESPHSLNIETDKPYGSNEVFSSISSISSTPELILTPTTTNPSRFHSIEPEPIDLDDSDDDYNLL